MRKEAEFVAVGDLIDLEGDRYADPQHDKPFLQCEYAEVVSVERETPDCVAIGFEGFDVVGFPARHKLKVAKLGAERPAVDSKRNPVERRLAVSLACYVSGDDVALDRRAFLATVASRIADDLREETH